MLKKFLLENLIFVTAALVPYIGMSAIVEAQERRYTPTVFTEPLSLSRGRISPAYDGGLVLSRTDFCHLVMTDWGWSSCDGIDGVLIAPTPGTDSLIVEKPNSEGFVTFDDWKSGDRADQIAEIEKGLRASAKAQGEKTGERIRFIGWRVHPTLDEARGLMYYATDIGFGDAINTNVHATLFDRKGYVGFSLVPDDSTLTGPQVEAMILANLAMYAPAKDEGYAAFKSGDKVAAVGALGVLAGIFGVKYGKVAMGGLIAVALVIAKKAMIVLVLPALWLLGRLKRVFFKD